MPKPRKLKSPLGRKSNILGRRIHPDELLTPLIRARLTKHPFSDNYYVNLYLTSPRTEWLPNGAPYKVTNDKWVKLTGGTCLFYLNQPLILVSDALSETERREVARHEFEEWKRMRQEHKTKIDSLGQKKHAIDKVSSGNAAHKEAEIRENPKLRGQILKKGDNELSRFKL